MSRVGRRTTLRPLVATLALVALAVVLGTPAEALAQDPYAAYRALHPDVAEEDLLYVRAGDALDRVLAVLHHPAAGFDPLELDLVRADRPGAEPVSLDEARAAGDAPLPVVVAVRQRCTPAQGAPFTSWFLVDGDGLRVWSLQPFRADCRAEDPLSEASDHEAMRRVGEKLFARVRTGQFLYGALGYEEWSEAFASPTPEGMLSRLQATAGARPHDAHAQNRLAVGLHARGERKAALQALERAGRLAPSWPRPHRNLAIALRQAGDLVAAARARERAEWLEAAHVSSDAPRP